MFSYLHTGKYACRQVCAYIPMYACFQVNISVLIVYVNMHYAVYACITTYVHIQISSSIFTYM